MEKSLHRATLPAAVPAGVPTPANKHQEAGVPLVVLEARCGSRRRCRDGRLGASLLGRARGDRAQSYERAAPLRRPDRRPCSLQFPRAADCLGLDGTDASIEG
ncbi:hypothetical protein QJS66_04775 [Kocuria rhizophila]|nr:hypothetical protein QJS66_04775 [Kocuria rhizophila]